MPTLPLATWMEQLPQRLRVIHYEGNLALLSKKRVAIVGSRKALSYSKNITLQLSGRLSALGAVSVSGAAIGIDALAHKGAGAANTIAVLPCSLSLRYPKINSALIDDIAQQGLLLSPFESDFKATPWSFVARNEVIVALSDVVVIMQADLNSGSMHSASYAIKHNKPLYVLSHRIGDSLGTDALLQDGRAKPIYDIDTFCASIGLKPESEASPLSEFERVCATGAHYENVAKEFPAELFEAELAGSVKVVDGKVYLV